MIKNSINLENVSKPQENGISSVTTQTPIQTEAKPVAPAAPAAPAAPPAAEPESFINTLSGFIPTLESKAEPKVESKAESKENESNSTAVPEQLTDKITLPEEKIQPQNQQVDTSLVQAEPTLEPSQPAETIKIKRKTIKKAKPEATQVAQASSSSSSSSSIEATLAATANLPMPKPTKTITKTKTLKTSKSKKGADITQPKTVSEWLDAKIKKPSLFTLTSEGNLRIPPIQSGESEHILDTPEYEAESGDNLKTYFKDRSEKITTIKENYSEARRYLFKIYREYKSGRATVSEYLIANKQVVEAEQMLIMNAIQERSIQTVIPQPLLRDLLPEEIKSKRTVPHQVYQLQRTVYSWPLFLKEKRTVIQQGGGNILDVNQSEYDDYENRNESENNEFKNEESKETEPKKPINFAKIAAINAARRH
jgi:hypothetical protein